MKLFKKDGSEIELVETSNLSTIQHFISPKRMSDISVDSIINSGLYILSENRVTGTPITSNGFLIVLNTYQALVIQIYVNYDGSTWLRTRWANWNGWIKLN